MKAIRKRVISFALMIAMVLSLLPFTALNAFAEGESEIYFKDCTVIGEDEDREIYYYYYYLGEGNTTIALMDLEEVMEGGMITGLAYNGLAEGTHIVDLTDGFGTSKEFLMEQHGEYLDETVLDELDFSNIYGLCVFDDDYNCYYVIIQGEHIDSQQVIDADFTVNPGTITNLEEDAYSYDDGWMQFTANLYTVDVASGTAVVNLAFADGEGNPKEVLVYGYDENQQYVGSYAPNETGAYGNYGQEGASTAIVKADQKGNLPYVLFVQTPYDESGNSTMLYVIHIEPTYTFTLTVNGETFKDFSYADEGYEAEVWGVGTIKVPLYTVNIPKGTEEVTVSLSQAGLLYNYADKDHYLGPWYDNDVVVAGITTASMRTDYDGNGAFDYIQVQKTYSADYSSGGDVLYAITFTSEEAPTPVPAEYSYDYEYGSEYEVMTEARAGSLDDSNAKLYYDSVVEKVTEKASAKLDKNLPNSNAKVVLALTASGYDAESVAGYNLVEPLTDLEYAKGSYVTNAAYSLLALDAAAFLNTEGLTAAKDGLSAYLYESLGDNGVISYEWGGKEVVSVDSTAMVLQALAKHYSADDPVIAKAIAYMGSAQKSSGGFTSDGVTTDAGKESTSTTAQVLLALAEYGIDPAKDERFIKLGSSALDYLNAVKLENGFKEKTADSTIDALATQQANMALTSIKRLEEEKTAYFDFSDVIVLIDKVREAILGLSVEPRDYTADDTERVEAIWKAFQTLSEEEQAILDAETSHADTGQPLGRVLETALWAVWSYKEIDNSTTLPDGTYDASTIPALSSEYSKGKSTSSRQKPWSVKSITVSGGKATATITVESTSYTDLWKGGVTYPKTNTSGNSEFANVPIDLNSTFYFAGVSSSMPQSIAFSLTSSIDEFIPLTITNETNMFKAVSASLKKDGEQLWLVMALSGSGYHELFKGTYEEAVANGDNTDNWIHGYQNDEGKWEFKIPVSNDESYMPLVAISDSYYQKYLNGQNPLARAFYPRQLEVDAEARTLVTGDYDETIDLTIMNHIQMFSLGTAKMETVGGPNSNGYKVTGIVTMGSDSLDAVYIGSYNEAVAATEVIPLDPDDPTFTIDLEHIVTAGDPSTTVSVLDEPIYVSFRSKKKQTWYERIFTFSKKDKTLVTDPSAADYTVVEEAKAKAEALDSSLYSEDSFAAVEAAVAAVEEGKFESQQADVDAMAKAINDAIAALRYIPIAYDGGDVTFLKSDLKSAFGMWAPQDGSTVTLEGDNVVIHIIPKNTTTYGWMHWGGTNEKLTKDVTVNTNGTIDITVGTDKCGYAYPVAPIKKKDGGTTSDQYYLTIPALERLQANEAAAAVVEDMISKLPVADKLTLADKDKVQAALDTYKDLSEGEKAAVNNYQELKLAETVIKLLYAQALLQEMQDKLDRQNERIYGSSRYETSRKVANRYLEESGADKFDNIVVACGTNFPDALGAGYLAKVKDAPILLVGVDSEAEIANYISEKLAEGGNVYLIGGTGAVSEAFEASISENANVKRLFGLNRYDTNIEVLKEAGVSNEDILVCTGTGFADSLSATSVGLPILLVGDSLTDEQKEFIETLGSEKFYLIGGTGVVKDSIATEIKGVKDGAEVNRIAGANRYATSTEVAKTFFPVATKAVLAYAQNFPDGLSAGGLAIKIGVPVILADSANTSEAAAYVKAAEVKGVITIGGPALISDQAVNTITGR